MPSKKTPTKSTPRIDKGKDQEKYHRSGGKLLGFLDLAEIDTDGGSLRQI